MKWVETIDEVRKLVTSWRKEGLTVGLVPTMGYFHEGHQTLMREAKKENDRVVVTLFVNPTQFGPKEDFSRYPRDAARDREMAEAAGADVIFAPTVEEMYPEGFQTWVDLGELTQGLCGTSRPGHFRGVATVVTKLFMIVGPDRAYFGEKDAQQLRVIRRMVRDLNMPLIIRPVPIVREADGLAMSSRNVYLSLEERQAALVLSKSLFLAKELMQAGQRDVGIIRGKMLALIRGQSLAVIDYLEFVDDETLKAVECIERPVLIALAVKIGKTRLIDNMVIF